MNVTLIDFSPTGGTRKVATILGEALGGVNETIDLCDRELNFDEITLPKDTLAIVAAPAYGGLVPDLAAERLAKINGNGCAAVAVAVYGGRAYEDTLIQLVDLCDAAHMSVFAGVAGIAQHSILPQFATDRPNLVDAQKLKEAASTIKKRMEDSTSPKAIKIEVPGNRPYKIDGSGTMVPKTSKACLQCKLCAINCPAGAISLVDCTKTDSNLCIGCMRCVRECPQEARSINKMLAKAVAMAIKKECSIPKNIELYI